MHVSSEDDQRWMRRALEGAVRARQDGDVPVGAVAVYEGVEVGFGWNTREKENTPIGHAEIKAIEEAAKQLGRWRLTGVTVFTTLEPCVMCAGAMVHARIDTVVFGAFDPKAGAAGSVLNVLQSQQFNHRVEVVSGVLEQECGDELKTFFRERRKAKKAEISGE